MVFQQVSVATRCKALGKLKCYKQSEVCRGKIPTTNDVFVVLILCLCFLSLNILFFRTNRDKQRNQMSYVCIALLYLPRRPKVLYSHSPIHTLSCPRKDTSTHGRRKARIEPAICQSELERPTTAPWSQRQRLEGNSSYLVYCRLPPPPNVSIDDVITVPPESKETLKRFET